MGRKMKVLIISMFPKEEVPYSKYYIDKLNEKKIDYDILYWNREHTDELTYKDNEIHFNLDCRMGGSKYKKIPKMLKYARTIRRMLRKKEYTQAIVLTTVPGIFLFDILVTKFKRKYILDIRDYTNESNKLYYNLEKRVIDNSLFTVISSERFKDFLPSREYILSHNLSNEEYVKNESTDLSVKKEFVIGFVGNVRYPSENSELIKKLSQNNKFKIEYWGKTTLDFESKAKNISSSNVKFHGKFNNEEKSGIYEKIDFINAIYGTSGLEVITAVPNRFYDALLFKKPIITSKGTYLGELVEELEIGLAVDIFNDDIILKLEDYIENFDKVKFLSNCEQVLKKIEKDQNEYAEAISEFIGNH